MGAGLEQRLHISHGGGSLEPSVVARTQAEQHDMVVIVDQSGDRRASAEVECFRARAEWPASGYEESVLDRDRGDDGVSRVHGMDLAVDQSQVPRPIAAVHPAATPLPAAAASTKERYRRITPLA